VPEIFPISVIFMKKLKTITFDHGLLHYFEILGFCIGNLLAQER